MFKEIKVSVCILATLFATTMIAGCSKQESEKPAAESASSATEEAPVQAEPSNSASTSTHENAPSVENISSLRPTTALDQQDYPVELANTVNDDRRKGRAYPMQPPIIPHKIDGYQIDQNTNKCLSCHARNRTEKSGAIMVSVTHYMNRDYQVLAEVSPRRYFCTQCHVVQKTPSDLVKNEFLDAQSLPVESPKPDDEEVNESEGGDAS